MIDKILSICGYGLDAEVAEEGVHVDPEGLVVTVDRSPGGGDAVAAPDADSGQERGDDLVAEDEHGGDGAGGLRRDLIPAAAGGLDGQGFAAELAQVISRLAGGVAGLPAHRLHPGGEVRDGE